MEINRGSFKAGLLDPIFNLTGKTWLKVTGASVITNLVLGAIGVALFLMVLGSSDILMQMITNPQSIKDNLYLLQSELFVPSFFLALFLFVLIAMVIGAWNIYFSIQITDSQITTGQADFGDLFKKSFSSRVFSLLGVTLLICLAFIVGVIISFLLASISGWLTFFAGLFLTIAMFRLTLIVPAMIVGNHTLGSAFEFSVKHIDWMRALKLFGIVLLVFLAIIVVGIVLGLIGIGLAIIPFVGIVIKLAINLVFSGFITALMVSALLALYYHYAEEVAEAVTPEADQTDFSSESSM